MKLIRRNQRATLLYQGALDKTGIVSGYNGGTQEHTLWPTRISGVEKNELTVKLTTYELCRALMGMSSDRMIDMLGAENAGKLTGLLGRLRDKSLQREEDDG